MNNIINVHRDYKNTTDNYSLKNDDMNSWPPPFLKVCHSFLRVRNYDFDPTPSLLFAQCHPFCRFFMAVVPKYQRKRKRMSRALLSSQLPAVWLSFSRIPCEKMDVFNPIMLFKWTRSNPSWHFFSEKSTIPWKKRKTFSLINGKQIINQNVKGLEIVLLPSSVQVQSKFSPSSVQFELRLALNLVITPTPTHPRGK